ncbi:uncharacterized protein N7511_001452 [Penicillium nucicola]|uniref:uncharacterized protein n=1 Tax=Penicillium nucicola TaxID=1850975 RepID=UPI002545046D|nr:uncharacterized protein N7511_001452 [Penicillium nucicola]KAJ5776441.1 hypothetical protein N7511_001452 [Penicillium nucicola]
MDSEMSLLSKIEELEAKLLALEKLTEHLAKPESKGTTATDVAENIEETGEKAEKGDKGKEEKGEQEKGEKEEKGEEEKGEKKENEEKEAKEVEGKEVKKDDEQTPQSRARVVFSRINTNGTWEDYEPDGNSDKKPLDTEGRAFTLRKRVLDDPTTNSGELDIQSLPLWDLLKKVFQIYPGHIFQGSPKTIHSPYEPLILYWDKLQETAKDSTIEATARTDLTLLLDTISSGSGDAKLDKYFKTRDQDREQNLTTYDNLWTLFTPGSLVYGKAFQDEDEVFLVECNTSPWPSRDKDDEWQVLCWAYDWNGQSFKRLPIRLNFEVFEDRKPITSLQFYPLAFCKDSDILKKKLVRRGEQYRKFCTAKKGSQMFGYDGLVTIVKRGFTDPFSNDDQEQPESKSQDIYNTDSSYRAGQNSKSVKVKDRVMVDFESYFEYGRPDAIIGELFLDKNSGECECSTCQSNSGLNDLYRTKFDNADKDGLGWSEEQYLLCPPRVFGYILREKQWAQLQVDKLFEIPRDKENSSWSTGLKLASETTKKMILDLVTGHGKATEGMNDGLEVEDLVERKGKGLVILLYGPPGVGKTSTAETVAIEAGRPLFSISVADVGTTAKHVEANLARIFALASAWQAILLIDEADVFLQSRSLGMSFGGNTERNALVSVFLRVLEYYQGILVLTTNQIAQFDVAVHSRIHIAIKYSELDETRALQIFRNFLVPLDRKGKIKDIKDIEEWLQREIGRVSFDGRQIRNVITSALSLARARGDPQLSKNHLSEVVVNVDSFKREFVKQFEQYKSQQKGIFG